MTIVTGEISSNVNKYIKNEDFSPLLVLGNSLITLQCLPNDSIDFCMTSPPYWAKREYHNGGIGLELSHHEYISNLVDVFKQVYRILKPTGSFWLNIGDTYQNKNC